MRNRNYAFFTSRERGRKVGKERERKSEEEIGKRKEREREREKQEKKERQRERKREADTIFPVQRCSSVPWNNWRDRDRYRQTERNTEWFIENFAKQNIINTKSIKPSKI